MNTAFILSNPDLVVAIGAIISTALLCIALQLKQQNTKELRERLGGLQKTYDDLDNQAKIIIKTDLELHKAQSELDKKIAGLYTLHKISRTLSTTMDENIIFEKISQEHITELGFDRVVALLLDKTHEAPLEKPLIKLHIGYTDADARALIEHDMIRSLLRAVIRQGKIISNLDTKMLSSDITKLHHISGVHSFICAPIYVKEGIIGALFVGSESLYSPITLGDKELVSILAAQIGQSLENASLYEETWRSHQNLEKTVQQRTKELRQALEEIKVVTQRKSDFVSAVSHELRTPLTSIKGYAALLSAGKLGEVSEGVKQRLEKINKHSDDLSRLINNLLDISRIESGRVEMKFVDINIADLLHTLGDLLVPQFKEKNITFVQEIDPAVHTIKADKDQLRRVFINLIGNALKFTPPQGTITVRAHPKDDHILFEVQDTGCGIAPENVQKVFEEFYREDNEANESVKGTGLGLALVKYIVEAHQGNISVSSALGTGTTFSFAIPIKQTHDEQQPQQ